MNEFVVVWDIAKKRDKFAGMVFHRTLELVHDPDGKSREIEYMDLQHIEKHGNLNYLAMGEVVENVMKHPRIDRNSDLLVDGTGVGEAAIDILKSKGLNPISIISTGGEQEHEIVPPTGQVFSKNNGVLMRPTKGWTVPKKNLVSAGQVVLQHQLLRVAEGLRWADDFKDQLEGFKGRFNEKTLYTKYQAESEELHDDLVVDFLMGAWWIRKHPKTGRPHDVPEGYKDEFTGVPEWDPIAL